MLDSIWQLLANYGLDVQEIADGIKSLIEVDANGSISGGLLEPLKNIPLIGDILAAFGGFSPEGITTTVATTVADVTDTLA